jgi:hypothetical protein
MLVNRRHAVKNIIIASGSLITLPFWITACSNDDATTHHSSFSTDEQKLLSSITDTIIPAGNSIGALSMEVDKFLQKLFDNCYEKDVQENIKAQLKALGVLANAAHKKPFTACTQPQREELLLKFSSSGKKEEKDFFNLIKSETIRGFNTSKKVMQDFFNYKVAPGHYSGCVNIKT